MKNCILGRVNLITDIMKSKPPLEILELKNFDTYEPWAGNIISSFITNEKLHKSLTLFKLAGKDKNKLINSKENVSVNFARIISFLIKLEKL